MVIDIYDASQHGTGPHPEDRIVFHLFGAFRCETPGDGQISFRSKKAEAIVTLLLLTHPEPVAREKLTDLLWSELPAVKAKASLRQTLSLIRKTIDRDIFIAPSSGWISLSEADISCDYWMVRQGGQNGFDLSEKVKGGFLDFSARPTERYDSWLLSKEYELKAEMREMLLVGLEAAMSDSASGHCPNLCAALLSLDPLDEDCVFTVGQHYKDVDHGPELVALLEHFVDQSAIEFGESPQAIKERIKEAGLSGFTGESGSESILRANRSKPPAIIVTPLKNLTEDRELDYFSTAIAEQLIVDLSQQRWFDVHAVELPGDYKPPGVGIGRASRQNHYALTGSYLLSAKSIRLTVRLGDANGVVVWSEQYDGPRDNLFDFSTDIVSKIAATLSSELLSAAGRVAKADMREKTDIDSWTLIMRARYLFWRTSKKNNAEARTLLDMVSNQHAETVPALTTAAFVRLLDVWSCWSGQADADLQDAVTLARKATHIDAQDPWAHFTLGTALGAAGQLQDGLDSLDRALWLQPTLTCAMGERARLNLFADDLENATNDAREAIRLNTADPHLGLWQHTLGLCCLCRGETQHAVKWAREALKTNNYWYHNHLLLAAAQRLGNLNDGGLQAYQTATEMVPNLSLVQFKRSHPFESGAQGQIFFDTLKQLGLT